MKKLALFIISIPSILFADDFQCEDQGIVARGQTYKACGIGKGRTEEDARSKAFDMAQNEFKTLCEQSRQCRVADIVIETRRTVCSGVKVLGNHFNFPHTDYTCQRLIFYHIQ